MDIIVQRVKNAHKLLVLVIMLLCLVSYSQNGSDDPFTISDKEYEVINAFYSSNKRILKIYHKTQFDKGWLVYFSEKDNIELITRNRGLGTYITDENLITLLPYEKRMEISSVIMDLIPTKLDQNKVTGAKLVKSFDNPKDENVIRISVPIIIDDLAVFRSTGNLESKINIMQRKNNKWKLIYTIDEWVILVD